MTSVEVHLGDSGTPGVPGDGALGDPTGRRLWPGALSVVLLLAVAAAAGAGRNGLGTRHGGGTPAWVEYAFLSLLSATGTLSLAFFLATFFHSRQRWLVQKKPWWIRLLAWFGAAALVTAAIAAGLALRRFAKLLGDAVAHMQATITGGRTHVTAPAGALTAGLGVGLLVLVGLAIVMRSPRKTARAAAATGAQDAGLGADPYSARDLEALREEPDPRLAVIGAYANMERCLAWAGIARRSHEAPFEHLDRVGAGMGISASHGRVLVGLYEQAKFAHHPCGQEMKGSALTALQTIQEHFAEALADVPVASGVPGVPAMAPGGSHQP